MSRPTVYLAGPVTGLDFDSATNWRDHAEARLEMHGIRAVNPLRCNEYLRQYGTLAQYINIHPLSTNSGITHRDRFDVMNCDAVLAYFPAEIDRVSIGTCIEFGWADICRKPVVMVRAEGSAYDHAMLNEIAGWITPDFDQGIEIITAILSHQPPIIAR